MNLLILLLFYCCFPSLLARANVLLISSNVTLSFDDLEASFTPRLKASGESGVLYIAEPINACSDLTNNNVERVNNCSSRFLLVIRGGCSFEDKVRRVQNAGFQAAIVYDNEYEGILVAMAGNLADIKIHALFVTRASGEMLKKYGVLNNSEVWLIPSFENSAWSIMAISLISLLAMSAALATCFFVRRHRVRREQPRASNFQEFHGMSRRLVKAIPSLKFTTVLEDNCTSMTCAICLEDYKVGDKLRVLPCRHKFHAFCVDSWLTSWRTFCPVCKRDARTSTGEPPASENTPLLSSSSISVSSSGLSSRLSLASSAAIQIGQPSFGSPLISRIHSTSNTPHIQQSFGSYRQSPSISASQSSVDLRNASSQRSRASHLVSPHSLGYPSLSPLNSRYMYPYYPSPSNASPSYIGSSSRHQNPLHCSESAASFSPFASAQSLPGC